MSQQGITSQDAALTINYIGFALRTLKAEGYAADRLLDGTGLSESDLLNPDFRCSFDQHKTFVLNAIRETGNPHLGLWLGNRFNPINIGLPASAAISSDIFATALDILQQFVSLNFSILTFESHEEGDVVVMQGKPVVDVGEMEYFVLGSSLVVTENFFKLLLGESQVIACAEFAMAEVPGWESYSEAMGVPFRFNTEATRILLPKQFLLRPLAGTDPVVHQHMLRLCEKQLAETVPTGSLEARVRGSISRRHYHNIVAEEIAAELGMSERSLRRQLSQADTSVKKILDAMREARARELLEVANLPVTTIAYDLGFSDPSNFARSFKRWVGMSPQEYRDKAIS
ncbi:AraC family transcriptional regulator [Maricurvus nonylphenolicus]|uniref:AraC family transcriptional regulator ligand-binding domain-containing protein n=1 Tax=Maricurvus nonylphenolicus TaxID=1008307 RepID=UPI0036F43AA2